MRQEIYTAHEYTHSVYTDRILKLKRLLTVSTGMERKILGKLEIFLRTVLR